MSRFRAMADKLQPQIDAKLGDRQTNTPKRQREAMSARIDGDRLERTQQALRALAGLHDQEANVPPLLAGFKTKKAIYEALGTVLHSTGYYHIGDTGEPRDKSPEAAALWALLSGKSDEQKRQEALQDRQNALLFANIPGYFPTPPAIVDLMMEHAQVEPTHSVLEPSAGHGAIVDALPEDCLTVVYERNHSLCEILQLKGYDARPTDFMEVNGEFRFDRVLMNPPFERGQDIEHVRHAFGKLKSGGRLVAIMSPGPFFRAGVMCGGFRAWLDNLGGEVHDLPAGSFKESGTGVSSRMIVVDRP